MKLIKNKKFLVIFLSIAISLVAIVIATCVFVAKKTRRPQQVDAYYDFTHGALTTSNSNYTKSTEFEISTFAELQNFASSVDSGCNFAGKTVKLTSNINGSDKEFGGVGKGYWDSEHYNGACYVQESFAGTFDGGGYTVRNFYIDSPSKSILKNYDYYNEMNAGFFMSLTGQAKIMNLGLENFTIRINYQGDEMSGRMHDPFLYLGGIAGCCTDVSNVTISNCSVKNMYVCESSSCNIYQYFYCGGILGGSIDGGSYANVTNCYVNGISLQLSKTYAPVQWSNADCLVGAFVGQIRKKQNSCVLTNCVLGDGTREMKFPGATYDPFTFSAYGDYWDDGIAQNCYLTSTNDYSGLGSGLNLGGENQDNPWYYYEAYSTVPSYSSTPRLRMFISWITMKFNHDGDAGTDSIAINVPNTITSAITTYISNNKNQEIRICGESVTAANISGYTFSHWTPAGKAIYNPETYTLNFSNVEGVSASKTSVTMSYNQTITIGIAHLATATVITYKFGTTEVTYTMPAKYTIDSYGSIKDSGGTSRLSISNNATIPDMELNGTYTLTPTVKLKSYNTTFQ